MDISSIKKIEDQIAILQSELEETRGLLNEQIQTVFPTMYEYILGNGSTVEDVISYPDLFENIEFKDTYGDIVIASFEYDESRKSDFDLKFHFKNIVNKTEDFYQLIRLLYSCVIKMQCPDGMAIIKFGLNEVEYDEDSFDWKYANTLFNLEMFDTDSNKIGTFSLPELPATEETIEEEKT